MSSGVASPEKDKLNIFETVLSSPGMSEKCKVVLQLSRPYILLLVRLIEARLLSENGGFGDLVLVALSKESIEESKTVHRDILDKSDLTNFYERLKTFFFGKG